MERLIGVVKQVISADTYVLLGPKKSKQNTMNYHNGYIYEFLTKKEYIV